MEHEEDPTEWSHMVVDILLSSSSPAGPSSVAMALIQLSHAYYRTCRVASHRTSLWDDLLRLLTATHIGIDDSQDDSQSSKGGYSKEMNGQLCAKDHNLTSLSCVLSVAIHYQSVSTAASSMSQRVQEIQILLAAAGKEKEKLVSSGGEGASKGEKESVQGIVRDEDEEEDEDDDFLDSLLGSTSTTTTTTTTTAAAAAAAAATTTTSVLLSTVMEDRFQAHPTKISLLWIENDSKKILASFGRYNFSF